jgi:hypothetical protein
LIVGDFTQNKNQIFFGGGHEKLVDFLQNFIYWSIAPHWKVQGQIIYFISQNSFLDFITLQTD